MDVAAGLDRATEHAAVSASQPFHGPFDQLPATRPVRHSSWFCKQRS